MRVLDPMVGSGTTLVVAKALGHSPIGFDSDPLAVVLARAWCADVRPETFLACARRMHEQAAKDWRAISGSGAYPSSADEETRHFVRYWYDLPNRKQLTALSRQIVLVRNAQLQALLWCALSRLVIVKSVGASRAMDVAHSRPHRVYDVGPISPIEHFQKSAERVASTAPFVQCRRMHARASIRLGDARQLPLEDDSVDVVITSPPYLNGIDYLRGNKFSLVWMGRSISELRKIRSTNVGTEVSHLDGKTTPVVEEIVSRMTGDAAVSARTHGMLTRYVHDMSLVIGETARVVRRGGRIVFVVGDSIIQERFVRNSIAVERLARERGLRLVARRRRKLADRHRYLPPPSHHQAGTQLGRRLREEVVLSFTSS